MVIDIICVILTILCVFAVRKHWIRIKALKKQLDERDLNDNVL